MRAIPVGEIRCDIVLVLSAEWARTLLAERGRRGGIRRTAVGKALGDRVTGRRRRPCSSPARARCDACRFAAGQGRTDGPAGRAQKHSAASGPSA